MTTPSAYSFFRSRFSSLLMLVIVAAVAIGTDLADARLRDSNGRWAFRGHDYNDDLGGDVNDPMTIIYKGGRNPYTGERRETSDAIKQMLSNDWQDGNMDTHFCNAGKWLWYWPVSGSDVFKIDDTDLNMSTSGSCKNQWHTRIWNDREINDRAQWEVGGIHREVRSLTGGHRLNMSFELAEQKAVGYMSRYCSLRNWRALPGSGPRKFHGFYSNGKISRISMKPVDHSRPSGSKCRGAFR